MTIWLPLPAALPSRSRQRQKQQANTSYYKFFPFNDRLDMPSDTLTWSSILVLVQTDCCRFMLNEVVWFAYEDLMQ